MDAIEIDSLEAQLGQLETQLEKVTSTEIKQLESENRKLEYRLESVKRAIEQEANSVPTLISKKMAENTSKYPSKPAGDGTRRTQPEWAPPPGHSKLKLLNSLTRSKVPFVPIEVEDNHVSWYNCGPTVYDASHMGHARNYITVDITRRIIQDFFGYDISFVQNITDIDDKIIMRARQNHLFENFLKNPSENWESKIKEAISILSGKFEGEEDADKKKMYRIMLEKCNKNQADAGLSQSDKISGCKDALVLLLDKELGHTVTDNNVFWEIPRYWEAKFWEDMDRLNVRRPDVQTRVSEYVPEIVEFVEKIIAKGYAYESNGSVYFDVHGFNANPDHFYAKLEPENMGNQELLMDGEGKLIGSTTEKRSQNDFALWKASKPGEPTWESPWSNGRPGWHIECSVMCCAILGGEFDIHTGGVDLKFPHHDNEIAQSEACYGSDNWCNYFMHSGHLHIEGCKMSKSLKNFITIDEALQKHSARRLRLAFLMHTWHATLDYSERTMHEAEGYERTMQEFFLNLKDWQRKFKNDGGDKMMKPDAESEKLRKNFVAQKKAVYNALADNFDTPKALECLKKMVNFCNVYQSQAGSGKNLNIALLETVGKYITWLFKVFGVIGDNEHVEMGFEAVNTSQKVDDNQANPIEYLEALSDFRENVRQAAIKKELGQVLQNCDKIRDDTLPSLGVRLEDLKDGSSIKIVGKQQAMKDREDRIKESEKAAREKQAKLEKAAKEKAEKEAKRRVDPMEMYKIGQYLGRFTKFDDKGLPTHEVCDKSEEFPEGEKAVAKGQLKKLAKVQQKQEKDFAAWKAEQ
jgi:cysteinyl-tRNA synthetase